MRIVVALGGNALLRRDEPMTIAAQHANVKIAAEALAVVAREHQLVITHGNGPQVGLMALQAAAYNEGEPYSLDIIGAATAGMIGYMIEQEIGNILGYEIPLATILTRVEVDPDDPAFDNPTKFVGPGYEQAEAERLRHARGWTFKLDGDNWRRVVPSPIPKSIIWHRPIRWLLEKGTLLLCAGGGGIPVMYKPGTQTLVGVDAVIDKDQASSLLARELPADMFVIATAVDGVYENFGTANATLIRRTSPQLLEKSEFSSGSMAPKVDAACRFVRETGNKAVIGLLENIREIIDGSSGTIIEPDADPEVEHSAEPGITSNNA
jgi:carbamate kinase